MTVQFPGLAESLGHGPDKVGLTMRALHRRIALELQRMENAAAANECKSVRELGQWVHACHLKVIANQWWIFTEHIRAMRPPSKKRIHGISPSDSLTSQTQSHFKRKN